MPEIEGIKPEGDGAGAPRKWNRDEVVPIICAKLSEGGTPLNVILAEFDPPIHPDTVLMWRKSDAVIGRQIDIAFETGSDRMAMDWLGTAEGKKPGKGGRSSGNVKRDRMICNAIDRLLTKWDRRYNPSVMLANDPVHPVTNAKPRKPTGMTEQQLIEVAARGIKGLAEEGQQAAAASENKDG